jgi:hypothetical protein
LAKPTPGLRLLPARAGGKAPDAENVRGDVARHRCNGIFNAMECHAQKHLLAWLVVLAFPLGVGALEVFYAV